MRTANDILHGDEHFSECFGDCEMWCTCAEEIKRLEEWHDNIFNDYDIIKLTDA
jgi:hypothetical protein